MSEQSVIAVVIALVGTIIGALVGGGTVLVLYGRAVKSILDSPVIIRSLELAAASLPPEALSAIRDTGKLLTDIGTPDATITTTTTTPVATVTTTSTPSDTAPIATTKMGHTSDVEAVPITDRAVG